MDTRKSFCVCLSSQMFILPDFKEWIIFPSTSSASFALMGEVVLSTLHTVCSPTPPTLCFYRTPETNTHFHCSQSDAKHVVVRALHKPCGFRKPGEMTNGRACGNGTALCLLLAKVYKKSLLCTAKHTSVLLFNQLLWKPYRRMGTCPKQ